MCTLKSCGMTVVCTWELRGIFFLTLVLFVLFSHGAVRCFVAGLFPTYVLSTVQFLILRILRTACVCCTSDICRLTIFPRESEKKSFGSTYAKKIEAKKRQEAQIT